MQAKPLTRQAMAGLFTAAALAAAALAAAPAQGATERVSTVGHWGVYVTHSDGDDQFVRCMTAQGDDYEWMGFGIDDHGTLEVWMYNDNWRLTPGREFQVRYRVDNGPSRGNTFVTVDEQRGYFSIDQAETLYRAFRAGHRLYVETDVTTMRFNLKGSAKALKAARDCWNTHLHKANRRNQTNPFTGRAASRNPFGGGDETAANRNPFGGSQEQERSSGRNPFGSTDATREKRQARNDPGQRDSFGQRRRHQQDSYAGDVPIYKATDDMLKFSEEIVYRLEEAGFEPLDELPEGFDQMSALSGAWMGLGSIGFVMQSGPVKDYRAFIDSLGSRIAGRCVGEHGTHLYERKLADYRPVMVAKVGCTEVEKGHSVYMVVSFYPWNDDSNLVTIHMSREAEGAQVSDEAFYTVARALQERSNGTS